jgi:aryl-alcohol dehydrogenase-like predicted oxidoreductase
MCSVPRYIGEPKNTFQPEEGFQESTSSEGVKASLKRLGQEYVDICFCHRPDI